MVLTSVLYAVCSAMVVATFCLVALRSEFTKGKGKGGK